MHKSSYPFIWYLFHSVKVFSQWYSSLSHLLLPQNMLWGMSVSLQLSETAEVVWGECHISPHLHTGLTCLYPASLLPGYHARLALLLLQFPMCTYMYLCTCADTYTSVVHLVPSVSLSCLECTLFANKVNNITKCHLRLRNGGIRLHSLLTQEWIDIFHTCKMQTTTTDPRTPQRFPNLCFAIAAEMTMQSAELCREVQYAALQQRGRSFGIWVL